jgi:hypothetical protein
MKSAPKSAPSAPKSAPSAPKSAPSAPKSAPSAPKLNFQLKWVNTKKKFAGFAERWKQTIGKDTGIKGMITINHKSLKIVSYLLCLIQKIGLKNCLKKYKKDTPKQS